MKRFILGTLSGVLIVAIIVTFIPDRAHSLIDQAGDVRGLLEDVAQRLEKLEEHPGEIEAVEVLLPTTRVAPVSSTMSPVNDLVVPDTTQLVDAIDHRGPPATEEALPVAAQRQGIDYDNLAAGLSRVSGALERLNRTMKPGIKSSRKSPDQGQVEGNSSS